MYKLFLPTLLGVITSSLICLSGCDSSSALQTVLIPTTTPPNIKETASLTAIKSTPTITTTATPVYPQEKHISLPSGLRIDEYALMDLPSLDPLSFVFQQGSQTEILASHAQERQKRFFPNFIDDSQSSMVIQLKGQELIAREEYTTTGNVRPGSLALASVSVLLNGEIIDTLPAGDGSALNPLQGLWAYDDHWVLEIAYITITVTTKNGIVSHNYNITGIVVEDSVELNEQYGYQEMFGFQLMNGKPFYFFKNQGQTGISYDNQITVLGYKTIPHYGCCSSSQLNPSSAQNMVNFFAEEDGVWYYVEIGVYE